MADPTLDSKASGANYSPKNVAPLIEFFAAILGKTRTQVEFSYPAAPKVDHPNDKDYLPAYLAKHSTPSPELLRYEEFAKRSQRLKEYQDENGIEYFQ